MKDELIGKWEEGIQRKAGPKAVQTALAQKHQVAQSTLGPRALSVAVGRLLRPSEEGLPPACVIEDTGEPRHKASDTKSKHKPLHRLTLHQQPAVSIQEQNQKHSAEQSTHRAQWVARGQEVGSVHPCGRHHRQHIQQRMNPLRANGGRDVSAR